MLVYFGSRKKYQQGRPNGYFHFHREQNAFDYSILPDIEDRRHFEKLCGKIEAQYPSIAKSVKKGSSLSEKP
jgi:hypothetical protein